MTTPWTKEHMAPYRDLGDEPADRAARGIIHDNDESLVNAAWRKALLGQATPLGGEAWEKLAAQFTSFSLSPAEEARLLNGQKFFATWGPLIGTAYLMCSLPNTYAAANGVKVLWYTARLQTDATRRVIETCRLLLETMKPQQGLDQAALETIFRVRLMHAYVRELTRRGTWTDPRLPRGADASTRGVLVAAKRRALARARAILPWTCTLPPKWDKAGWGEPLNQDDLLATLMAFAYLPIWSLQNQPVEFDPEQADDYVFAWSIIGRLLGIHPDLHPLLPTTVAEAKACWEGFAAREQEPSCHGREMTLALIRATERNIPGRWLDPFVNELFFVQLNHRWEGATSTVAEMHGLRRSRFWKHLYAVIRRVLHLLRLQESVLNSREAIGYDLFHWIVTSRDEYRGGAFQLPESLREIWGLDGAPEEVWAPPRRFNLRAKPLSQRRGVTLAATADREANASAWAPSAAVGKANMQPPSQQGRRSV